MLDPGCLLERLLPAGNWTPDVTARWVRMRGLLERVRLNGRRPQERALFSLLGNGYERE